MTIKLENMNQINALYSELKEEFDTMLKEKELCEEELWDAYLNEIDEDGFSVHTTCDEIWCILDYAANKNGIVYPIEIEYNKTTFIIPYNHGIDFFKMLMVNRLWTACVLEKPIKLNGEDINEINKKIDF